jgi:hypothetical protein
VPSGTPKHSTDPLRCTVASATSLSISTLDCLAAPQATGQAGKGKVLEMENIFMRGLCRESPTKRDGKNKFKSLLENNK